MDSGTAALLGALIGGLTTLVASYFALRAEARRDRRRHEHEQVLEIRSSARADVRELLSGFLELKNSVDQTPRSMRQVQGVESFGKEWDQIWTEKRRNELDVLATLIPDERARSDVNEVLLYLRRAVVLATDEYELSLPILTSRLAEEGVAITGAYLRSGQRPSTDSSVLPKVRERAETLERETAAIFSDPERVREARELLGEEFGDEGRLIGQMLLPEPSESAPGSDAGADPHSRGAPAG